MSDLLKVGLATEGVIPDVAAASQKLLDDIAAHARQDFSIVHGNWTAGKYASFDKNTGYYFNPAAIPAGADIADPVGKKVGDQGIQVLIDWALWLFPASSRISGPLKVPQVKTQPVSGRFSAANYGPLLYSVTVIGTVPMAFQWEITCPNSATPLVISPGTNYGQSGTGGGVYDFFTDVRHPLYGNASSISYSGGSITTTTNPVDTTLLTSLDTGTVVAVTCVIQANSMSVGEQDIYNKFHIQCRVFNGTVAGGFDTDGGYALSTSAKIDSSDDDDSC
jgi:hypothetical protein